jgi:hypothetical protein
MKRLVLLVGTAFLLAALPLGDARAVTGDGYQYGLGLAGGFGVSGISGTMDLGGPTSVQIVAGNGAMGKIRFAFKREEYWDLFVAGYGGVHFGWDDDLVAGGGVGVDWNWQSLDRELPPISFMLEVDLGLIDGDLGADVNGGIHFNFNL